MKWVSYVVIGLLCVACTKRGAEQPATAVEEYIKVAMNAKSASDKQALYAYTTGEARAELEKMSDKDFDEQFVQRKMSFKSFKAKDLREEAGGGVSLVYELAFLEKTADGSAEITNRKIAYLQKDSDGHWKITSTKNVKSFIEREDALEVSPSTPGAATPPTTGEKK
jgi:ketosteroid isomerase-like protein